jgi:hypothetical protein
MSLISRHFMTMLSPTRIKPIQSTALCLPLTLL